MSNGWMKCNIEEYIRLIDYRGRTPIKTETGVRLITAKNVKLGYLQLEPQEFINPDGYDSWMTRGIPKVGDIIFTTEAPLGNVAQIETSEKLAFAQRIIVMQPDRSKINPTFLKYLFLSEGMRKKISEKGTGATVVGIKSSLLKKISFSFPSLPEQKRIVEILDEAFAAIDRAKANVKKNLQNTKELLESYLKSAFLKKNEEWEEKKLSEIAIIFARGKSKHRPRNDKKLYGGIYPFIQTGDVRNANKHISCYSQTYNEIGLAQSRLWPKGTICITIAANIAETGILDFDSCFPDSMIGLVVDESKADVNFTYYVLQFLKRELQGLGKGSAQDNINLVTFEDQYFPFPSVSKQKLIAERLDLLYSETRRLEALYHKKMLVLEELEKSILQKAFSGELTSTPKTIIA